MKVRIYSDLHLEFGLNDALFKHRGEEQLVVLAGDIAVGSNGVCWAAETFPHVPVVYVLGNHEYYHQDFEKLVDQCREKARGTHVHILEQNSLDIDGIRVLGCTLWTDYALFGVDKRECALQWASESMADFLYIRRGNRARFTPLDALSRFDDSAKWLEDQIQAADRPLLVVTHHAPSAATISPIYDGEISNASFHSNADHLLRQPVRLWVHGHTHHNADLHKNGVRLVTNQWGYPNESVPTFRRDGLFTIDLEASGASA